MQDKLQELTDRLYAEGLSKGKEEGERLLAQAHAKADETIAAAKAEAAAIIEAAEKSAADLRAKAESDVRMASAQALQATRSDIEKLIIAKAAGDKVSAALADSAFIKEIIRSVAASFAQSEATDIRLVLPASLQAELEPWVAGELSKAVGKGIQAEFSKKIGAGFTIAPKDGGWYVDLSDEAFGRLIAEYLRPVTRKILFGE